jgi:orotate phosphoribosyltransferase
MRREPDTAESALPPTNNGNVNVKRATADSTDTTELADRILKTSLRYGDFVLSSGRRSRYYVDKYKFLCDPRLLRDVAGALLERVPEETERIVAVEGGASLLVTAMSLESDLPFLIVRKGRKGYGTDNWLEGDWQVGMKVVLVEDVVTTGAQMAAAAQALADGGLEIVRFLCVVNRGDDAGFARDVECLVRLSSDDSVVMSSYPPPVSDGQHCETGDRQSQQGFQPDPAS